MFLTDKQVAALTRRKRADAQARVLAEKRDKRIAKLEAKVEQLEAENALMKKKAHVSFGCFWNGGWYSNVGTEGHIDHSPTPPAEGDGNE